MGVILCAFFRACRCVSGNGMKKRTTGFYIFCVLCAAFAGVLVWGMTSLSEEPETVESAAEEVPLVKEEIPPARAILEPERKASGDEGQAREMSDMLLINSLRAGSTPTQDVGERGSLEGALITDTPMVFAPSKYERLPNSPLYIFTDDMVWRESEDTYRAKKDALHDQALSSQEASIALSVSPRVEMGKTTGYRFVEIPDGTLFSKLGMVSGDIVVSINGRMPDMEPMALMFVNMAAGRQGESTIVVEHRGVERTIHLKASE